MSSSLIRTEAWQKVLSEETEGSYRKSSGHVPEKALKYILSRDQMANIIASMWNLDVSRGEYKKRERDKTSPQNNQWIDCCELSTCSEAV